MTSPTSIREAMREEPGCVNPVPAEPMRLGFRLLVLRCYANDGAPPSFAWIGQRIFRTPERASRHGLHFGLAFRPDVMSWLTERFGRPSIVDEERPRRNPRWPKTSWRCVERHWPEAVITTEWLAETLFASQDDADAFCEEWRKQLAGEFDD